jgi:hypothetical protein
MGKGNTTELRRHLRYDGLSPISIPYFTPVDLTNTRSGEEEVDYVILFCVCADDGRVTEGVVGSQQDGDVVSYAMHYYRLQGPDGDGKLSACSAGRLF